MKKKEIEKVLGKITAYNFSKLDTVESFLKFFNNIAKKHPDAISIKINLDEVWDTFDRDELTEIDILFTKRALETNAEFNDRKNIKMKNDKIKFDQMKKEYGWK